MFKNEDSSTEERLDLEEQRQQLLQDKASILNDLEHLGEAMRNSEVDIDLEEGDPQIIEREKYQALVTNLQTRLKSVERALAKIDLGVYGICERCGKPIAIARLIAKPDATLCIKCRSEVEKLAKRGIIYRPPKNFLEAFDILQNEEEESKSNR